LAELRYLILHKAIYHPNHFIWVFNMRLLGIPFLNNLKIHQILLVAIAITVVAINLNLYLKMNDLNAFGTGIIFWVAVTSLVWDKRNSLKLDSGLFASFFAVALLTPILIKSVFIGSRSFTFLALFPTIAGLGLALLASGFKGINQYWRELLALSVSGISKVFTAWLTDFDPSLLTAQFSTYILWYLGFPVTRQGGNIYFDSQPRAVDVYAGCSGIGAMLYLLSLSVLFFLVFPTNRRTKVLLPIVAVVLGFVTNALRVALLAYLNAYNYLSSFDYWHDGEGSLLFSILSAVMLCGVAFWLMQTEYTQLPDHLSEATTEGERINDNLE
jgi:cyanoexosortase A